VSAEIRLAGPAAYDACDAAEQAVRDTLGTEPDGAELLIRRAGSTVGQSHELVCRYDRELPGSMEYAFRCWKHLNGQSRSSQPKAKPRTGRAR
jgi:hypothetical protein